MPAKDAKAYVKRNKNDAADAEAICEAVRRPTMRFGWRFQKSKLGCPIRLTQSERSQPVTTDNALATPETSVQLLSFKLRM